MLTGSYKIEGGHNLCPHPNDKINKKNRVD